MVAAAPRPDCLDLMRAEIDAQSADQPDVGAVVAALEAQFDAFAPPQVDTDHLTEMLEVPSADEIGARLEAFLEANDRPADGEDGSHESHPQDGDQSR